MRSLRVRRLTAGVLGAAVIALPAAMLAGGASAKPEAGTAAGKGATIKMKMVKGKPAFTGPKKVGKGQKLKVVNRTAVEEVGPHTFTLIEKGLKPRQVEDALLKAHKVKIKEGDPAECAYEEIPEEDCFEFRLRKPVVDNGKEGWDRPFGKRTHGDSWYTETEGEKHSRKVKARKGTALHYFCAIHPFMKGKIKVTRR